MRKLLAFALLFGILSCTGTLSLFAQETPAGEKADSDELAAWLNQRFAELWKQEELTPARIVDDGTFLRRVHLDLMGAIPSVSRTRDFLEDSAPYKRKKLIEDLATDRRNAEHLARIWRRIMFPQNAPGINAPTRIEPWLTRQFSENVPYDELARDLITARSAANGNAAQTSPVVFYQVAGRSPDNLATSFSRLFLGVRIGCAKCHDHPFTDWKQKDFWGMAAFFAGVSANGNVNGTLTERKISKITNPDSGLEYPAQFLWGGSPEIPRDKYPREVLAQWMTSAENPNFAANTVNRVWQYFCGRPLAGSVDDLDLVSPSERALVLDQLAAKFVDSDFDLNWLIEGICKSNVYQRAGLSPGSRDKARLATHRPLKTLTPEQVFDSLEQALSLPVSNNSRSPRFNGQRAQLVARLEEAFADAPDEFQSGIPQALMMMNGRLTAEATSLKSSRTLRAVVDAPFLTPQEKIETLYLAAFTRMPRPQELDVLLKHLDSRPTEEKRRQAYAEIFWGLLNSPEFVLSR